MISALAHPLMVWGELNESQRDQLLARPQISHSGDLASQVAAILTQVSEEGDAALRALTLKFDRVKQSSSRVTVPTRAEAQAWLEEEEPQLWEAVVLAEHQLRTFHQLQQRQDIRHLSLHGSLTCERLVRPLTTAGFYIPGGEAPLISTLLMLAVPAQLAGVHYTVVCSPPQAGGGVHPLIAALAGWMGLDEVHAVGGAQAIAAMAYGTTSVRGVDKIFGPGNAWVTMAKQQVAMDPSCRGLTIDMPAGPSEVMVLADASAQPQFIAADLLAQAEHGQDSHVITVFIGGSAPQLYADVLTQLAEQVTSRTRRSTIEAALKHSRFIAADDPVMAAAIVNRYAPEHLIIQFNEPRQILEHIQHAGSIFLGHHTPESFGDYASGTNHVLPTGGYARSMSGLTLEAFQKTITIQEFQPPITANPHASAAASSFLRAIKTLAHKEGLDAHAHAVTVRQEPSTS